MHISQADKDNSTVSTYRIMYVYYQYGSTIQSYICSWTFKSTEKRNKMISVPLYININQVAWFSATNMLVLQCLLRSFTNKQLDHIVRRRLSDIYCDNLPLEKVREDAFLLNSEWIKCGQHRRLDLDLFLNCWTVKKRARKFVWSGLRFKCPGNALLVKHLSPVQW